MDTDEPKSEYRLPIFVSSAVRGLIDLRAELRTHFRMLGYAPILSSDDGFHAMGNAEHEPWERCLPVLANCYVVVVILDGRYGKPVRWPHFVDVIGSGEMSPVEAEYRFAHRCGKTILVFVRNNCDVHYSSYQKLLEEAGSHEADPGRPAKLAALESSFSRTLPDGIELPALQLLHRIHSDRPQPWITVFDESPRLKEQVQRQLVSELVRHFRDIENRQQVLAALLQPALEYLGEEDRNKLLGGDTNTEFLRIVRERTEKSRQLSKEVEGMATELETTRKEAAASKEEVTKSKRTIGRKEEELEGKKKELARLRSAQRDTLVGGGSEPMGWTLRAGEQIPGYHSPLGLSGLSGLGSVGFSTLGGVESPGVCESCQRMGRVTSCILCGKRLCEVCKNTLMVRSVIHVGQCAHP